MPFVSLLVLLLLLDSMEMLFTATLLDGMVLRGNRLSSDPVTTDPLELEVFTRFICLLLVTDRLMFLTTGVLLTMTCSLWTLMSTACSSCC